MADYKPHYDKSWALVVGINEYKGGDRLDIARADAESMAEVLISELGFPKENVTLLLDEAATKKNIMDAYLSFSTTGPNDRVLFFFAGHGDTVTGLKGDVGYLVPVDGDAKNRNSLIRWTDLTTNADVIPAKHVYYVMDCCYSGLATQRSLKIGTQRFVGNMLERVARQVVTAGKADEVVADGGGPTGKNSIFTGHLLEGIRGKAFDEIGVLTAAWLNHYVCQKVSTDPNSNQTPHSGTVFGDGDFILRTPGSKHLSNDLGPDNFLVESVPEHPEPPQLSTQIDIKPVFAEKNGYGDPESDTFGRNEWSAKLGQPDGGKSISRPNHWIAFVVEPVSNEPIQLDFNDLAKRLSGKQYEKFRMPRKALTTAKGLVLYDQEYLEERTQQAWLRFIRIDRSGAIEFCDCGTASSNYVSRSGNQNSYPVFLYIQTIGLIWTFLGAVKSLLGDAGYTSGIRLLVNLVGAENTLLVQFAEKDGPTNLHWREPFDFRNHGVPDVICRDSNLQIALQISLSSLGQEEIKKVIKQCAVQLGLAYNHQSEPRCFILGTDIFPWEQFNPDRAL